MINSQFGYKSHQPRNLKSDKMSDKYLDNYLPVIAIDVAIEEKTRIAKMAAATLHKLHNVMQQMRDWRDDSAKLKSNIWRMKMALRTDDESENNGRQIDPLIAHQKTEISRLEQANDALENEVSSLKRALTKAEDDIARIAVREIGDKIARIENEFSQQKERLNEEILCLRTRLKEAEESQTSVRGKLTEFAKDDRTIETVFANAIGKIVGTVVSLSEGLVNVSEDLYRFKTKNRNLRRRLRRLRAMLRSKCGSGEEYQRRICELNNLAEQLTGEMSRLKVIRENIDYGGGSDTADIPDIIRHVERLMNDLRNNLKSDREAMIAAGDPDCLKYMKKIIDLKINLKVLSVELRRSNASMHKKSLQREKRLEATSLLSKFLKKIDIEIGKMKVKSMDKYCRIGGVSGSQYMTKVAELENIVRKSATIFTVLKENPLRILNTDERIVNELENLIERLCCKINDLEVLDDRANLHERIDQLEAVITHLKLELIEKNERINTLNNEYTSIELTLKKDREKQEIIIGDMRRENDGLREDIKKKEQEISGLSHEREHSERRVAGMQLMKAEIDAVRKKLQGFYDDKEALLRQMERMHDILRARGKKIENIITERDAPGGALGAEVKGLRMKLEIASDENVKLKSIIDELEKQAEPGERRDKLKSSAAEGDGGSEGDNGERSRDRARNLRDELERLKAESNESEISLNESTKRIDHSKRELDEAVSDKTRLQGEISDLKSNEQSLMYRLNVQTSAGEETSRESKRVMAENKALASEVKQLRNEKEQLEAELSELRTKKGLLDRSTTAANNKCATLQDQVNKFKSECNGFREKISERETAMENLKFELEKVRAELENAAVEAARLQTENSKLVGEVDALSLRNTETEKRVRVLLTEKNDLATRINELNDESVDLRERLNKARAENEYFSMELNKSRVVNDKAKAENARLQVTCDELRVERDDSRKRVNEIGSKCRVVGNQLKIQRVKYEALRLAAAALYRESNDRRGHLKKMDTLAMSRVRGFADAHNEIKREQDYSDAARTCIKVAEIGGRRYGDEAELKVESDTCTDRDNKARIKDRPKDELKSPGIENKALKLKQTNSGYENPDVMIELARTEEEFECPVARTREFNDEEIVGSVLKKFEIANILSKKGTNNYSSYFNEPKMLEDKGKSTAVGIDQLKVENRTLKTEVDILRSDLNSVHFNLTDGEKTRLDLGRATEEIRALKFELMNLRDEKAALRSRLEMFKGELDALKAERLALKDELAASRKSNFDLRLKVNDLRSANEKLKETNAGLESRLQNASRKMSECTAISEASDKKSNSVNALNNNIKNSFAKGNLQQTTKSNRTCHLRILDCNLSKRIYDTLKN